VVEASVRIELPQIKQDSRGKREAPITFFDLPEDILDIGDLIYDTEDNVFVIEFGNKVLNLQLDDSREFILARSGLYRFDNREKKEKDTTYVYKVAREIMRRVALHRHKPVLYSFFTSNEGITKWAMDKTRGASVFDWHSSAYVTKASNRYLEVLSVIDPEATILANNNSN
jgi:hypothetical protein